MINNTPSVSIQFEGITERDMDFLFMRKISEDYDFLNKFFLSSINYTDRSVEAVNISHSVSTEDGETDIEVILILDDQKKIALLIENKIDAPAMEEQAERYHVRGKKAIQDGKYDEYYVFIVAPEKYLTTNAEAAKYPNKISYESIRDYLTNMFEKSVINKALAGYGSVALARNKQVTDFWNQVYDFADENYKGIFNIHGKKGLLRSGIPGQWITINCAKPYSIQIKSDRGYVDLEIRNYADKFVAFCKDNATTIDNRKLFVRTASKSLAIRRYIEPIDFTKEFESQKNKLTKAFDAAKDLQELIHVLHLKP